MTVILLLFGVGDIAAGVEADPAIVSGVIGLTPAELRDQSPAAYRLADFMARSGGLTLAVLGTALTILVAVPYRRRANWAWGAMWLLPAWALTVPVSFLLVGTVAGEPPPPPMVSGPIFAVAAAGILLVDRRRSGWEAVGVGVNAEGPAGAPPVSPGLRAD